MCWPGLRVVVVKVAGIGAVRRVVAPSLKVAVPEGIPEVVLTVRAVKVRGVPAAMEVADGMSVVSVGAGAIVTLAGDEVTV